MSAPVSETDTIAAVSTGSGKAGIGVVRISGPLAEWIARTVTDTDLQPRCAHYLPFLDEHARALDEGIAILFKAPHSFTGEDVLELQGHGGAVVLDLVLARVLQLGARAARPGEFSERAFHNNKLDLAQAEAISDLIESSNASAARAAVRSMRGEFSAHIQRINEELIGLRVWLEAALDFSEEDIDFLAEPQLHQRAAELVADFDLLLSRAEQGQRLRDGMSIVIAGATNAGKSSLLNCLSGHDTAIVTDIAGTTRDVLRSDISIDGVPMHITDTAGVRATTDVVEKLGIERAIKAVEEADHVLVLLDVTAPVMPELPTIDAQRMSVVLNKTDLVDDSTRQCLRTQFDSTLEISTRTGQGLAELRAHLLRLSGHDNQVEGVYIARRRHLHAIESARQSTDAALTRLKENVMPELAAEELRLAQQSLALITGRFDSEDLLGEIFSNFCIGK
ncbi:MAG: tRNA uridine-5-carboxymethylaminomethyl(34) synthesis GTPase MnmE [Granulosicoccus sp.]